MTPDLVKFEWFDAEKESRPIRFVQEPDKVMIPVNDIAQATGVRKRALLTILEKNEIDFREHQRDVRLSTPGGYQQVRCVDRDGAMMLLFKISTGHIKREDIRVRLNLFKEWQIKKMGQPIALPAPQPEIQKEPDYAQCLIAVKFAQELSRLVDTDPLPLVRQALDHYDLGMYGGLIKPRSFMERFGLVEKPALPPAPPEPKGLHTHKYLTCKDIGEIIGKSAHEVYMFLYQRKPPLVSKDYRKDEWRITDAGREFGWEESREVVGGYIVWRIKWKKDVLRLFNVFDHEVG